MRYEQDGVAVWSGTPDAPAPAGDIEAASGTDQVLSTVTVGVQPPSASNLVVVTYRLNGGPPEPVTAALLTHDPSMKAQYFTARLPAFHVNDAIQYSVAAHLPGRQVPDPGQAGQLAASFRVVPDPPAAPGLVRMTEATRLSAGTMARLPVEDGEPGIMRPAVPPVTARPVAVTPIAATPVTVHPVITGPGACPSPPGRKACPPPPAWGWWPGPRSRR